MDLVDTLSLFVAIDDDAGNPRCRLLLTTRTRLCSLSTRIDKIYTTTFSGNLNGQATASEEFWKVYSLVYTFLELFFAIWYCWYKLYTTVIRRELRKVYSFCTPD